MYYFFYILEPMEPHSIVNITLATVQIDSLVTFKSNMQLIKINQLNLVSFNTVYLNHCIERHYS